MDIVQRAEQQLVPHVAAEVTVVATIHIHRIHQHLIPHQVIAEAAEVVVAQEVQSLVGHKQVLQFIIHLLK
jgi:hypothetical protein